MANTFNYQTGALSMKALRYLKNKLVALTFANTNWAKDFRGAVPIGDTLQIPLPPRYTVTTSNDLGYAPQALTQLKTPVTVDTVSKIHFEWDDIEAALYMQRNKQIIRDDFVEIPMSQMAAEMDSRFAEYAANNSNNIVGVLGTDPTDLSTFAGARQRMAELGASLTSGKKGAMIAPQVNTSAVNAFKGLFQDDDEISRQYKEGTLGRLQGFRFFESMSLKKHTAGTWQTPAAVTVNGAGQSGASLLINCTSGDTFKKGDKIGIAGVYRVNPQTRQVTTYATTATVTVLEDVTATAATATLSISPALTVSGAYQNVSGSPANAALLTLFPGTSSPNGKQGTFNLFMQSDAFAFVPIKLDIPREGGTVAIAEQVTDPETGITVRFVRVWEPMQSKWINRFDVVYGFGRLHSDAASVVLLSA